MPHSEKIRDTHLQPEHKESVPRLEQYIPTEIYERDYARAEERFLLIQSAIEQKIPAVLVQNFYSQFELSAVSPTLIDQCKQVSQAFTAAITVHNDKFLNATTIKDTAVPYEFADFQHDPYELISASEHPGIADALVATDSIVKALAGAEKLLQQELAWTGVLPQRFLEAELLKFQQPQFAPELQNLVWLFQERRRLLENRSARRPSSADSPPSDLEKLIAETEDKAALAVWWENFISAEGKEHFGTLSVSETVTLELILHRYLIRRVCGLNQAEALQKMHDINAENPEGNKSLDRIQFRQEAPCPLGFKLHISGSWRLFDYNFYQMLRTVKAFTEKHGLAWKCWMPTNEGDIEQGRSMGPLRLDSTMCTIWTPEFAEVLSPIPQTQWKEQWLQMLQLGKELDELLAEQTVSAPNNNPQIPPADTDWQLKSSQKSSGRVGIRFGTNTENDDEVSQRSGAPDWEDDRHTHFADNLIPALQGVDLKGWAAPVAVELIG